MKSNKNFEEYSYIENYQGSYLWLILIIATFLLLFIILGVASSFYNYTIRGEKDQPVMTDILFQYSDVTGNGNGIFLEEAKEMIDDVGRRLTGAGNAFEFNVHGNPGGKASQYTIVVEADPSSTISSEDVKVYLTKVQGSVETPISEKIPTYNELENFTVNGQKYKKVYSFSFRGDEGDFSHDYILRMWIRNGATDYYKKNYSLKVHVLAEGVGE